MVDYRQESIENARGAIKGGSLLNGGAAVALLTQLSTIPQSIAGAALTSMIWWSFGLSFSAFAWVAAFGSTRYVDKWQDEGNDIHRVTSNRYQTAGIVLIILSIICFIAGSLHLAAGFNDAFGNK
jgi:hypothetical protein